MKRNTLLLAAGVGAPLVLSGTSHAGYVGLSGNYSTNPSGILVLRVYAVFDRPGDHFNRVFGTPQSNTRVWVWSSPDNAKGNFYQFPSAGDTAPDPTLFDSFPGARYDTYVTIGVESYNAASPGYPEGQIADTTTLSATWPGFDSNLLQLTQDSWSVLPGAPQGDPFASAGVEVFPGNGKVLIGQFSTKKGILFGYELQMEVVSNGETIIVSESVYPAPPTLALLAIAAGLDLPRRRRPTCALSDQPVP